MKEITARVSGQNLVLDQTVLNVAGSVNLYKLKITFDEDWETVDTKIVSFSNGCGKGIAVEYNEGDGVTIPWEVLKTPEGKIGKVHIGVLGYAGTDLRITTTSAYEANVLIVMPASLGLEAAMTPTPDIYQKLLQAIAAEDKKIGQLANLDTDDKTNLVAAINEVLSKISQGGGTVKSVNNIEPDDNGNVAISIPTKTSELENNSDFQNGTQTAATANAAVATHNTSNTAHADIREAASINAARIDAVDEKIPAQASASNQLADKAFVNSTVQTSSANFRGNWANWAAVPTNADDYPIDADGNKTPTKNDYMVVQDASDFTGTTLTGTWRFKYSGEWATDGKAGWHPEYQVNETPLTAAQLAALNSGITESAVSKLDGIEAGAEVNDIDSISVNGTLVAPDANKNVDLTIEDGIKTLTTADYNYPVDNPTCIAAWLLDSGMYRIDDPINTLVRFSNLDYNYQGYYSDSFIIMRNISSPFVSILASNRIGNAVTTIIETNSDNGNRVRRFDATTVDNLTSNSDISPLSAKQGKVLNEKIVGTTETKTIATTDWTALTGSDPYDYSATITATASISSSTGLVELLNDQPALFATHGFAIGAVSGQTVTIYSIGQPDASVSLKLNIRNL